MLAQGQSNQVGISASGRYLLCMVAPPWLVRNFGPRCTLVCAASVLRYLGALSTPSLVGTIETATGFRESYGPPIMAYLGGHSALDRGIEQAAAAAGLRVSSRTRFLVRWRDLVASLDAGVPVVLNCYRAPSRQWSHSVLAVDYADDPKRLLTLDPNDGAQRWLFWRRPSTGWICTATFVTARLGDS
jgi:hypothetical protein